MKVALITEYDGTDFVGFQSQNNGRAVHDVLTKALCELYKTDIKIEGCSRTDSGVHAGGHVSSLNVPFYIPEEKLPMAVNALLPDDLSVKKAVYVKDDFSARFSTLGKRYSYSIYSSPVRSPLKDRYSYHTTYKLSLSKMKKAAVFFSGEHDFASFCASGSSQKTTVRRLFSVDVFEKDEDIEIVVQGEAFLYNMVRIIAGTLLDVGCGKIEPEDIPSIIESCDRKSAGRTLPARGLKLEEVYYDWEKYKES
ncbi:MAG: tRNA pseudouridine(38-40) synthase TruA [Clostridiales bacterium]|nr:tRNA pseudouridine(38-40) synthase TruA [Clostridiales bacterium]